MTYQESLSALSDPTRRIVFEAIANQPSAVGDLAANMPVSRPAVSQHLKVLSEAGLVVSHAKGTKRIYRVRPEGLADLRRYLEQFWETALDAFANEIAKNEGGTE